MSGPRLDLAAQGKLLGRIAGLVVSAWPPDTEQAVLDYGSLTHAADVRVRDGVRTPWVAPDEVWEMMRDLRNGMYTDESGMWVSARLVVRAEQYDIKYRWPSR